MAKTLLVTGSSGLIGSEVCGYFARELGYTVHGLAALASGGEAVSSTRIRGLLEAGEIAAARARGPGSFAVEMLDALHNLDRATLVKKAKVK